MKRSLNSIFDRIKSEMKLPKSLDIQAISNYTRMPVNRKTEVEPLNLITYLRGCGGDTRVATFCSEVGKRIGAQVGVKVNLYYAGARIDGRRSLASLR